MMIRKKVFHQGEYERSFIRFQFNVDGKMYLREEMETFDDEIFIKQTLDALNINNSLLSSVGTDLRTSLQPYSTVYKSNAAGALTAEQHYHAGDQSNFMTGLPFCDSEDFIGGISTSGTVQIELHGDRKQLDTIEYRPTCICFEDALLKIRAIKPDGRKHLLNKLWLEQLYKNMCKILVNNMF